MIAVLRDVFLRRQPAPEESTYCRNRFFLGTAWSQLESNETAESIKDSERVWEPWTINAVAYPDPAEYSDGLGPDWGLCQEGTCGDCGNIVRSNVKKGLCSICDNKVYMT